MPNGITIDDKEFARAMRDYKRFTGKDMSDVANGKLRDWMFKAGKAAPRAKRDEIERVIESPKFIAWFANKKFGKGNWTRSSSQTKDESGESSDWAAAKKILRRRLSSVGYAKSGFIKAAKLLPNPKGSRPGKQSARPSKRFSRVKAFVKPGTGQKILRVVSEASIHWPAYDGKDKDGKQAIAIKAIEAGRTAMVRDTRQHLAKKAKKSAAKVSAK